MEPRFLTEWFGIGGAVFAVLFSLFKTIWPKVEKQMDTRNELKRSDQKLRAEEQNNVKKDGRSG